MDYDQLVLQLEANTSNAISELDSFNKVLKEVGNSASGGAGLERVNAQLREMRTEFRQANAETSAAFSGLQAFASVLGGAFNGPLFAIQRYIQAQTRLSQTSQITALQRTQNELRAQAAIERTAQVSQSAADMQSQANSQIIDSFSEILQQRMEEGESIQDLMDAVNGQTEAYENLQQAANQAMDGVADSVKDVSSAFEGLQDSTNGISESIGGVGSGLTTVGSAAPGAATGVSGLTGAVHSLNAALAPILPVLLAIAAAIKAIQAIGNAVGKVISSISGAFDTLFSAGKKVLGVIRNIWSTLQGFAKTIASTVQSLTDSVASFFGLDKQIKKSTSSLNKFQKIWQKAWNVLTIKVLRNAINSLFGNVEEGFQQLAVESQAFNLAMSTSTSGVRTLSNAFTAALAPAIQALMPIINAVISALTRLFNLIAAITAALFGQATYFAANDVWEDYAAGANAAAGATKALKDAMNQLPFDELNNIANPGGSGGGGGGGGNWFTEMETPGLFDFDVREWVRNIIEALNSIDWDSIQLAARRMARTLANIINEAVDEILISETPGIFGTTIAQALNTAIYFAEEFINTIDWGPIGQVVGININSAIEAFDWGSLGRVISGGINAAWTVASNALASIDFFGFGTRFGTLLNESLGKIDFVLIGQTIADVVNAAVQWAGSLFASFDLSQFAINVASGINAWFERVDFGLSAQTLSDGIIWALNAASSAIATLDTKLITDSIKEFFENVKWNEIKESIVSLFSSAWDAAREVIGDLFGVDIGSFENALLKLADVLDTLIGLARILVTIKVLEFWGDLDIGTKAFLTFSGVAGDGLTLLRDLSVGFTDFGTGVTDGLRGIATEYESYGAKTKATFTEASDIISDASDDITLYGTTVNNVTGVASSALTNLWLGAAQEAIASGASMEESINRVADTGNKFTTGLAQSTETVLSSVRDGFSTTYDSATKDVTKATDSIVGQSIPEIEDANSSLTTSIAEEFGDTYEEVTTQWDEFSDFYQTEVADEVMSSNEELQSETLQLMDEVYSTFEEQSTAFERNTSDTLTRVQRSYKAFANNIISMSDMMFAGLVHGVNEVINALNTIDVSVPSWVPTYGGQHYSPNLSTSSYSSIPSLRVGMSYVPEDDFVANLHKGEAVLTLKEANLWRQLGGENGIAHILDNRRVYMGDVNTAAADAIINPTAGFANTGNSVSAMDSSGGVLQQAFGAALRENADIFVSPDITIGGETIYNTWAGQARNRGVSIGGAFATAR